MSTLESYLTTIADAIRVKKGTTEPINASNFASEILSIQGGGSLNVAYSLTPPTDTSKIWLQCAEPSGVEVQNYLGECAVSNVANWGGISDLTSSGRFFGGYFSTCYIGNNQIAIVGYNKIAIYDLIVKSYIKNYTTSTGDNVWYTNVLCKDNILYFGYASKLYSYNLTTQTLATLYQFSDYKFYIKYIFFNNDNEIYLFTNYNSNDYSYVYKYNMTNGETTQVTYSSTKYFSLFGSSYGYSSVKTNNYVYFLGCYTTSSYVNWKYNLSTNKFESFTSWKNFVTSLGVSYFQGANGVYDGDRYIYIIGGGYSGITYDNIIKYDTVNDTFEMLDNKLLSGKKLHFVELIDNRVYIFGGMESGTSYGRQNNLDYFDLSYPLTQNNAIITIANYKDDNALPLINTEKLKLNSNIASAYLGNANNLAEKVNAYYHNGNGWVGINCTDYDTYFVWQPIPNKTINSALVIDLSTYYTTNSKDVALSVSSTNATAFEVTLSGTELTVKPLEVSQTTTITVTATVNAVEYQTTFTVTSADIITSA